MKTSPSLIFLSALEKKIFPVHATKRESGGIAPLILKFGTRWAWMVSSTLRPLYPWKKKTRHPL